MSWADHAHELAIIARKDADRIEEEMGNLPGIQTSRRTLNPRHCHPAALIVFGRECDAWAERGHGGIAYLRRTAAQLMSIAFRAG